MAHDEAVILWASQPAAPGEVVMLAGHFPRGQHTEIEVWRLEDDPAAEPSTDLPAPPRPRVVAPVQGSDKCLKLILPRELAPGLFACRIEGGRGAVVLNRPQALWAQGDRGVSASPGGWVRILGTCLQSEGAVTVLLRDDAGGQTRLTPTEASPYSLACDVPDRLPQGDYAVLVHNGRGGAAGWSAPLTLRIAPPSAWPARLFNVRDFGAAGGGDQDDTAAVKAALAAAERAGGGIVYFPRGRYLLSDMLEIPRFTVLKGEARELTALSWSDFAEPPEGLVHGDNSFGVEDLTITCYNYQHVILGDPGSMPEAGDIFLRRLRVRALIYRPARDPDMVDQRFRQFLRWSSGGGDTVRMGGRNIEITDCDFHGSGRSLYLSRARGAYVARNIFRNGRWGWYSISGSDGLIFEHNEIAGGDLMSTGGGLNCLDGSNYSQNIYFAHNRLRDMYGWDREAMTSDAGGGAYFGAIAAADGADLTLAADAKWGTRNWAGAAVFILDGRGAGQYRRIAACDGRRVTLDRPWEVAPDASSLVSVTMLQRHYLIIGNHFSDATVAVQFYGISIGHIVAGNRSVRAGGFHNLGIHYHGYQPSWFVQFLDNEIAEGNGLNGPLNESPPSGSHLAVIGGQEDPYRGPLARWTVMRRNRLLNNSRIEARGMCEDVVIADNEVRRTDRAFHADPSARGVLLWGNRFEDVTSEP